MGIEHREVEVTPAMIAAGAELYPSINDDPNDVARLLKAIFHAMLAAAPAITHSDTDADNFLFAFKDTLATIEVARGRHYPIRYVKLRTSKGYFLTLTASADMLTKLVHHYALTADDFLPMVSECEDYAGFLGKLLTRAQHEGREFLFKAFLERVPDSETRDLMVRTIMVDMVKDPRQDEVDWSVVRDAIVDTCDIDGIGGPKALEHSFARMGLIVAHKED